MPFQVTSSSAPGKNSSALSFDRQTSSSGWASPWLAAEKAWPWTTSGGAPLLVPARTTSACSRIGPLSTTTLTLGWVRSNSRTASMNGGGDPVVGHEDLERRRGVRWFRAAAGGDQRERPGPRPPRLGVSGSRERSKPSDPRLCKGAGPGPGKSGATTTVRRVNRLPARRRSTGAGSGETGAGASHRRPEVDDDALLVVHRRRVGDQAGAVGREGAAVAGVDEHPGRARPTAGRTGGARRGCGPRPRSTCRRPGAGRRCRGSGRAGPGTGWARPRRRHGPAGRRGRRRRWRRPSRACRRWCRPG